MKWRTKARIQNTLSLLPSSASYAAHYWLQRRFGHLKQLDPVRGGLEAGIETCARIEEQGGTPVGKVFLEVGTGRVPLVPLALFLMGAERTVTVDVNPYLKQELVKETVDAIAADPARIRSLFGERLDGDRLDALLALAAHDGFSTRAFLDLCRISYVAPRSAEDTGMPDRSVDYVTSYNVLEHIPKDVLIRIIKEGSRVVRSDGLFVHRIDYSDHFSHDDDTISRINFLRFTDREWQRLAGNRYMYANRLRHDDYVALLGASGHRILAEQPEVDPRSQSQLRGGFPLSQRFRSKSKDVLAITSAWIVSRPNR